MTPLIPLRIVGDGVAKLKAVDVLKTPQVQRDLAVVRRLRLAKEGWGLG